eukprot:scaffold117074_cov19-Prasinocladus_malaysianus.AAC.1
MGIAKVELHVNATNTMVGATVIDVTSFVSGSTLTYTYELGLANTTRFYWLVVEDDAGNSTPQALGSFTTADNTAPVIAAATQAAGTPPATAIALSFSVTDNDPAGPQTIYVYQSTSSTPPDAATVKADGVAKAGTDTAHTFTGLTPGTTYFAWVLGRDASGNESAVT